MDDLPADVRSVLTQLFGEARTAIEDGDVETARSELDTAETVVRNKVPDPERRDRLATGCRTARETLHEDPTTAVGYVAAMERRVEE